jgi:putative PEP-CTERM system TPR-repeat lipoprotein
MIRKSKSFGPTLGFVLGLALLAGGCGRESSADLVASGKALLDKKDGKGAVIQFKNALQKDGNNGPARFYLGKALLEGGEPASALVELRKALELQVPDELVMPELARAMLLTGEEGKLLAQHGELTLKDPAALADFKTSLAAAYAMQREPDKARAAAEEALRLRPGFAPATIVLVRLKALDGDIDGAIAMADSVIAADPANDRAGVLKGELLLAGKRDANAALATFRQVLKANPNSVPARVAATNILFQQQRTEEARAEFEQLKKLAPRHLETLFFEAQLAFVDKNFKRTRELTDLILKAMPDNVRVLELAGAAEFRMNGFLQAETFLAKALKLAPRQLLTRHMLAQTYLRSGQPAKALDALQPALEGATPEATTLSLAGEAHLQLGDAKRSEEAFQRALKIAPQDSRVRTSAALAQMARGNTAAAAAELEAVAAGDSGPRADLALVSARLRQGDTAGALKAIEGLEKKMPDQALPLQLRGRVLALRKDNAGARRAYEAALAKDPAYFTALAALAALDVADRKPDDARQRFDAHLKAYPKSWQAKLALAELDARAGAAPAAVLATLREAVKLNPAEPRPHMVLINKLLGSDDARAALQAAQDASAALPDNLEIMDARGRAQLAVGDNQGAIITFKRLAGLQPRSALPEMRLADAYVAAKDHEAATRSLRRAAELQPGLVAPQRALALLALQDNRPQDALAIAREMQKAHGTDPAGFVLEGDVETARKGWSPAVAAYRAALQRAPDSADLFIKLHGALGRAEQVPEAHRMAADWLKTHPKDPAFLYYLGDLALAENDLPRAERRYRAVLDVMPEHALAMNNVAWLMARQGKPGALPLAEKANQLMPNRAPLLDTLATVLEAESQLPQAIDAQKRAIALAPKDPTLNLRLAKLYIKSGDKAGARAELDGLAKLGDRFAGQAEVATLLKAL